MAIIDRTLRSTTTELHLQSILENALQGAMDLTKVEGSALCLLDRDSGRLVPGASKNASGPIAAALKNETIRIGGCLCGYAARDGEPSITWNGRSTSASGKPHPLSEEEIRFHAAFPLKVRNETIGMLCLFSRTNAKPDQRKLNLVQDICGPVALAIENARLYEEVLRHSEELENRVAERTAELAVAMEKAQAADQLKSAFLATMSHELRTPLNSIIGFTGIMLQGLTGPLNEEQLKQMRMVQSSARHLLALINDVLDISKIEAGQLELSNTAFDLRSSIERTARIVSPLAEKKGIDLRLEIGADVAVAVTDQRRLEQVILNLLNNAVKFTDKGYVSVSCRNENDRYVLSVTDTGVGIREEELPGLFRPFHQIDSGLARKHEGSGLGLSICEKLMEMMGGSIGVESQWGKGSTFTVRFPVNQEDCHDKDPSDH
jgi:signal transduction histidine kinase